jgi:hypothetical protein
MVNEDMKKGHYSCHCVKSVGEATKSKIVIIAQTIRRHERCPQLFALQFVFLEPQENDLGVFCSNRYRETYSPMIGRSRSPNEICSEYHLFMKERRNEEHDTSPDRNSGLRESE